MVKSCDYLDNDSPGYVVEYSGDFMGQIEKVNYACGNIITDTLAVVSVKNGMVGKLLEDVKSIKFLEVRTIYVLQDTSPSNVDSINQVKINPYMGLDGSGVLIGMIDSGINYLEKEFTREDGTSRVQAIWDQTANSKGESEERENIYIGATYNNEEINRAIKEHNEGRDPYVIVPTKDEIGHGTSMASIIGARGYNNDIEGVAKNCDFVVVKLLPSPSYIEDLRLNNLPIVPAYNGTEVLSAVEFLRKTAKTLNKPMVIYFGVGTNDGSHDGNNITPRYISFVGIRGGIVNVAGTGNAGNDDIHVTRFIKNVNDIEDVELVIPREIKRFIFHIWIQKPNRMSLNIVAPTGEETGYFKPKIFSIQTKKFFLLETTVEVICHDPESYTGHQTFELFFYDIKPGIWRFSLRGEYITNGRFDVWLRDKSLLPEGTKFSESTFETTLTIPSTARNVITVSYFNGKNDTSVAESGKGFNTNNLINPDIATEGIDILTIKNSGELIRASGSSAATAIVAGVCAIILQWGIVKGNDKNMNSTRVRSLIIYGAKRDIGMIYPNVEIGYGKLDLANIFNIVGGNYREYHKGRLFIRIPKEI